jgi:hypothetical protein
MESLYECTNYVSERRGNQVVSFDLHVGASVSGFELYTKTAAVASLSVTNGGSGYSSAPTVAIAAHGTDDAVTGVTGAQATVTATVSAISGGAVTGVTVTDGGNSYTIAPTVSFSGGGGAAATANIVDEAVDSISVTNGGSGYTSAPSVTLTSLAHFGDEATATAAVSSLSGGAVTGFTSLSGGAGYTSAPSVSFSGGGGSSAAASATLATLTAPVKSVTVDEHLHGFHASAPSVTFSGGGGSGAAGTAVLEDGVVTSVTVTDGGSGYTSAPSAFFDSPDTVEFTIDLHEHLRIDKLSDIYLDHFTTFNCVEPNSATNAAFIMELKDFNVKSQSNNQNLAFGRVTIPNNGKAKSSDSTGLAIHKASKRNYICQVNPMTLHRFTVKLTVLDGSTSIFLSPANGHRCFGEFVIVPRK